MYETQYPQQAYLQAQQGGGQLAPQGLFGSLLGGPVGGLIGRGIGGLFGNSQLGGQIGQAAGGIGGAFLPFSADPLQQSIQQAMQQQAMQQPQQQPQQADPMSQQLNPQGFFGNLLSQVGRPLGGAIGGLFGNQNLGSNIGGIAGQLGSLLPFNADPATVQQLQRLQQLQQLAQLQQQMQGQAQPQAAQGQGDQLAPQGFFGNLLGQVGRPLGGAIGGMLGNRNLGGTIGGIAGQLGSLLPFNADPAALQQLQQLQQMAQMQQLQQAPQIPQQAQSDQLAPQGFFGNLLSQAGRPLGSAIGGMFGNRNLGSTIGGIAGQLGSLLPFNADPAALQQLQQLQQAQQQLQQLQQAQQQGQGQLAQLAPQGFIGDLISRVGQPVGTQLGRALGNEQLGTTLGGLASQLGHYLPFSADPAQAQWLQQLQQQSPGQGALAGQLLQGGTGSGYGQQTIH